MIELENKEQTQKLLVSNQQQLNATVESLKNLQISSCKQKEEQMELSMQLETVNQTNAQLKKQALHSTQQAESHNKELAELKKE